MVQLKAKKKQPHAQLKKASIQYLTLLGWFVFPIEQGPFSYKGISDLHAARDGLGIWIEIKIGNDKQSEYQIQFQKDIEEHGGIYWLIYSIDELIAKIYELTKENYLLFN